MYAVSARNAGCKHKMFCYNRFTMSQPTPIDVTTMPDLARIVEEVEATKKPRELRRENKIVAVIAPAKRSSAKQKRGKTNADYEAL
jgi:hypothetical protein